MSLNLYYQYYLKNFHSHYKKKKQMNSFRCSDDGKFIFDACEFDGLVSFTTQVKNTKKKQNKHLLLSLYLKRLNY